MLAQEGPGGEALGLGDGVLDRADGLWHTGPTPVVDLAGFDDLAERAQHVIEDQAGLDRVRAAGHDP
jgi:hypothetical protein